MSLINEALKKARVEAARRDAAQQGIPVPKTTAYEPRRRPGRWIGAAVAAALGLGLAAAGGVWLAGRSGRAPAEAIPEAAPAPPAEAVAEAAAAPHAEAAPSSAGEAAGVEPAPAAAEPEEQVAAAPAEPPVAAAEQAPAPPAGAGTAGPVPADTVPADTVPAGSVPAAPGPAAGPSAPPEAAPPPLDASAQPRRPEISPGETDHVREAPLPGGGTLRLDGIAWSETTPAAVINGQIVGPGERIEGARVARVERDRVVVEVDGAELTIRLP